jgi:hypothetical protein
MVARMVGWRVGRVEREPRGKRGGTVVIAPKSHGKHGKVGKP